MHVTRLRRLVLRAVMFALLGLLVCFVALYFFPFSSRVLDQKIERSLSRALQLKVNFSGAHVFLSRGRATLENVRLALPEKPDLPILNFPRVDVSGSMIALPFAETKVFDRIALQSPSRIRLIVSGTHVKAPQFDELVKRIIRRGEQRAPRMIRIKEFEIRNGELEFISGATSETLALLHRCDVTYSLFRDGRLRVTVRADAAEPLSASLEGFADISADARYVHAEMSSGAFRWAIPTQKTPVVLKCARIALRTNAAEYSPPVVKFIGELELQGLGVESPSDIGLFVPKNVTAEVRGDAKADERMANFHRLEISMPDGWVLSSAQLRLARPYPFSMNVQKARIPQSFLDELCRGLAAHNIEVKLSSRTMTAEGNVEGTLAAPRESLFRGHAAFRNANVRFGDFPHSLDSLEGEVEFNNTVLEGKNVRGRLGRARFSGGVRLSGQHLLAKPQNLEVSWKFDAPAEDVLNLVRVEPGSELSLLHVDGVVQGKGKIAATLGTPPSIDTSGTLELKNVSLDHPSLPEPLREINGQCKVKTGALESEWLRGRFLGVEWHAAGMLKGQRYFWDQPRAEIVMTAEPHMETIRNLVQSHYANVRIPPVSGETVVQLGYAGRLDSFSTSQAWVRCAPSDGEIAIQQQPIERKLSRVTGEMRYEKGRMVAEIAEAWIGRNACSLSAEMENNSLSIAMDSHARLEDLKESFPDVLGAFRARGDAHIRAEALLNDLSSIGVRQFNGSAEQLSQLLQRLDFLATIETRDATFAYVDMPQDVTDIDGTFIISNDGLMVKGAHSRWGKSPDCLVDGTVHIEGDIPTIRFQLRTPRAFVDEWLVGWQSTPSSTTQTLQSLHRGVRIFANIVAETASYKGLQGKNLVWNLTYKNAEGARQLDFEEIRFKGYGGTGVISGTLKMVPAPHRMDLNVAVKGMNVQELLSDYTGRKSSAAGDMTGEMTLHREAEGLELLAGRGHFTIEKSRFVRNVAFETLGRVLHTKMFDDITFTTVEGEFELERGAISFEELAFRNPMLEMTARGKVLLDGSADAYLYLVLLPESLGKVPIVSDVVSFVEKLGRRMIKFHLTGTINKPRISPIPVSIDEIDHLFSPSKTQKHTEQAR
jgi:hypothetical protein